MISNKEELFQSIESNNVLALERMLTAEPSLANVENEQGLTPLGIVSHLGYKESVQVLLDFNADIDALSHSKIEYIPSNTALHAAIAGARNLEIIELLLKNKAQTNLFDSNGHTALHTAAIHDGNKQLIELLINHGALVHAKADGGKTAVEIAIEQGNLKVAEKLEGYVDLG